MTTTVWDDTFAGTGSFVALTSHTPNIGAGGYTNLGPGSMTLAPAGGLANNDSTAYDTVNYGVPGTLAQSQFATFYVVDNTTDTYLYLRYASATGPYYYARFALSGQVGIYYYDGSSSTTLTEVNNSTFGLSPGYPASVAFSIDAAYNLTLVISENNGTVKGTLNYTDASARISSAGTKFAFATKYAQVLRLTARDESSGGVTAPSFSGSIPTKSGATTIAFAFGTPAASSYFAGTSLVYSVSVALPSGLSIDNSTGVISGTPTAAAAWTGAIVATNSGGTASSNTFAINIVNTVTLTSPTKSTPSSTSAIIGFTTNTPNGTVRAVLTTSATPPSVAQVKAGQDAAGSTSGVVVPTALTISGTGVKNFAAVTVTSGLTYYGYVVHTDSSSNDSNVLATGALYPGTGRTVSDNTVTGFAPSSGSVCAAMLNEDTRADGTFVTCATLSGSFQGMDLNLDKSYPAGTYSGIQFAMWVSSGVGVGRVRFLDASGTQVGATASQALTTTPTLYTLPVTLTGTATRVVLEQSL